eukprot:TRINITY_DN62087_c0_g1_i1.p1 TRINITY_DN62087_c0_g1~~TRINITY_DN62087_c0_g1_i1.p1  ORF type:complete len:144 (-),score=41.76 TRINITY_DN62087_c0_g1_i1:40-450(-)
MLRSLVGSEMCIRDRECRTGVDAPEGNVGRVPGLVEGSVVTVSGLVGRPELNGLVGKCVKPNLETGRWEVAIEGHELFSFKAANLKLKEEETEAMQPEQSAAGLAQAAEVEPAAPGAAGAEQVEKLSAEGAQVIPQ